MKFIHLTDPHLTASDKLFKIDVSKRLEAAISHIIKYNSDADLCMITGDLSHWGEHEAYSTLNSILNRLPMPWHCLIGNHDNRHILRTALPQIPVDENGFFQYVIKTNSGYFVILDTVDPGFHHGVLCEKRLRWLRDQFNEIPQDSHIFLFLHHAPMISEISGLDSIRLKNSDDLLNLINSSRPIQHIFFGHMHRTFHGSWYGIPFSTVKGTAHQVAPDFAPQAPLSGNLEMPAYAAVFIRDDGVFIHDISFLEESTKFSYRSKIDNSL